MGESRQSIETVPIYRDRDCPGFTDRAERGGRIGTVPLLILLAFILILYGCGDTGGGGQGGNAEDTGLYLAVTSIVPNDTINGQTTSAVDIVWDLDCNDDGTPDDPEEFGAHSADVTLSLSLVEGATSPPAADTVYITRYTIDYTVNPGDSGPSLSSEQYWDDIEIAVGSSTTATLKLVDENKKNEYVNNPNVDLLDHPDYTATYKFYGEDKYGNDISAGAYTTITIGNYDTCSTGGS